MRIAILTLEIGSNYGGILQAYALQTILQRLGHTVVVLQRSPSVKYLRPKWQMPLAYTLRLIRKICKNRWETIFKEQKIFHEKSVVCRNTYNWIKHHINIYYIDALNEEIIHEFNAILVGSDQIWRKPYFLNSWLTPIKNAMLAFTKDTSLKKFAYAASFGMDNVSDYSPKDILECRKALKLFDFISVREDSGVDICKDIFGVESKQILDPTMLLTKEHYLALINQFEETKFISPGDMFCYILDDSDFKTSIINHIVETYKMKPFHVNADVNNLRLPAKNRVQPPVERWLKGFRDAKLVITDSYHGCVFSIIFGVPFLAIGNSGRGMSRFQSLFNLFHLQERLITPPIAKTILSRGMSEKNNQWDTYLNNINLTSILLPLNTDSQLCKKRQEALTFLSSSLSS